MSRRHRPSLTSPPPSIASGADDISRLSLPEIREWLARNARVLGSTGIFASPPPLGSYSPTVPSPTVPSFNSPTHGPAQVAGSSSAAAPGAVAINNGAIRNRPSTTVSAGTSPTDSVRDRLLAVRHHLLQREKELLMTQTEQSLGGLQLDGAHTPAAYAGGNGEAAESSAMAGRRVSGGTGLGLSGGVASSGKRAAVLNIIEREKGQTNQSRILPVAESLSLATREFDHATAARLSALTLDMGRIPRGSSSPKSRRPKHLPDPDSKPSDHPRPLHSQLDRREATDEIARAAALARMNAFMRYKDPDGEDDDGFYEDDEDDEGGGRGGGGRGGTEGMFDFEDQDYPDSSALTDGYAMNNGKRREPGTGEEVDEYGEDDERFAEGNEDFEGDAGGGAGQIGREVEMDL